MKRKYKDLPNQYHPTVILNPKAKEGVKTTDLFNLTGNPTIGYTLEVTPLKDWFDQNGNINPKAIKVLIDHELTVHHDRQLLKEATRQTKDEILQWYEQTTGTSIPSPRGEGRVRGKKKPTPQASIAAAGPTLNSELQTLNYLLTRTKYKLAAYQAFDKVLKEALNPKQNGVNSHQGKETKAATLAVLGVLPVNNQDVIQYLLTRTTAKATWLQYQAQVRRQLTSIASLPKGIRNSVEPSPQGPPEDQVFDPLSPRAQLSPASIGDLKRSPSMQSPRTIKGIPRSPSIKGPTIDLTEEPPTTHLIKLLKEDLNNQSFDEAFAYWNELTRAEQDQLIRNKQYGHIFQSLRTAQQAEKAIATQTIIQNLPTPDQRKESDSTSTQGDTGEEESPTAKELNQYEVESLTGGYAPSSAFSDSPYTRIDQAIITILQEIVAKKKAPNPHLATSLRGSAATAANFGAVPPSPRRKEASTPRPASLPSETPRLIKAPQQPQVATIPSQAPKQPSQEAKLQKELQTQINNLFPKRVTVLLNSTQPQPITKQITEIASFTVLQINPQAFLTAVENGQTPTQLILATQPPTQPPTPRTSRPSIPPPGKVHIQLPEALSLALHTLRRILHLDRKLLKDATQTATTLDQYLIAVANLLEKAQINSSKHNVPIQDEIDEEMAEITKGVVNDEMLRELEQNTQKNQKNEEKSLTEKALTQKAQATAQRLKTLANITGPIPLTFTDTLTDNDWGYVTTKPEYQLDEEKFNTQYEKLQDYQTLKAEAQEKIKRFNKGQEGPNVTTYKPYDFDLNIPLKRPPPPHPHHHSQPNRPRKRETKNARPTK